ncbi:MAG: HAD hydrolase-like protein [Sphingomonadales bacterium]|nr:HAD hydrolase-like protein [Sphingomonadales bacterium]
MHRLDHNRGRASEGRAHCGAAWSRHALHTIVEGVKRPDLYRRILRLTGTLEAFMVGDQLDRDIAPAKAAGLETIYFPGGFQPRWLPAVGKVGPDYTIASFAEVPDIVLAERKAIAGS